jgi:hypothetical protein
MSKPEPVLPDAAALVALILERDKGEPGYAVAVSRLLAAKLGLPREAAKVDRSGKPLPFDPTILIG